jgi:hypothetical protein
MDDKTLHRKRKIGYREPHWNPEVNLQWTTKHYTENVRLGIESLTKTGGELTMDDKTLQKNVKLGIESLTKNRRWTYNGRQNITQKT